MLQGMPMQQLDQRRPFVGTLEERGLLKDSTSDELRTLCEKEQLTVYCGFDPTARTLHIGNLLAIMGLVHCVRAGHNVIALVGGATARIGDPSGRSTERTCLPEAELDANIAGITEVLHRILDNAQQYEASTEPTAQKSASATAATGAAPSVKVVNNAEWYDEWRVIDFIADIGRHFRVNSMLAKDSVKSRMEHDEGISFTEFTYQVLQGHDFLQLFKAHNCRVQLGGSDQWGNITAGIDLVRRVTGKSVYGVTMPLLTTSTGEKFGKSAGNAVWLDAQLTSPYELYQFFINMADADVERYLAALTLLPVSTIKQVMEQHIQQPHERLAQHKLASEVVRLVHGAAAVDEAKTATDALFAHGSLDNVSAATLKAMFATAPSATLDRALITAGTTSILSAAVQAGLFSSKGEAKRTLKAGGLYVNNNRVERDAPLTSEHVLADALTVLRKGRKHYLIIHWST
ncbi:tyrosyl-tRNA synthetase [Salpingoeca rosetta]|uniref:Tyrosine--tRNA ligase n=1 Tax=Salpingoeca rosetta (strain ATCC 50818 / BSB-021) TaxID=946362 RepID=F2UAN5_SALR5|nr:tyrosyl-tRNA synthetase [Salpingoeca rosetta]EGD73451.1 tyrosyl-tRNA synthetase [Salpingoeca rosetta]|eukprot:XP_004993733.1 tyrosyl-tRNA synthetase [Salpingoeca rosetta]